MGRAADGLGAFPQIKRESQRGTQVLHGRTGQLAKLALKPGMRDRTDSLNVRYRFAVKKRKPRRGNLIAAVAMLRRERHVGNERAWCFFIVP